MNVSDVGGYFQDVHLAVNTHLVGGRLRGRIVGETNAPARLDRLTIMENSHLSGVKLGDQVVLQKNVVIEPLSQLPALSSGTSTQFSGGIAVSGGEFKPRAVVKKFAETVTVLGSFQVAPEQVGQMADLLVYMKSDEGSRMLDAHRAWLPWDAQQVSLVAFRPGVMLTEEVPVELYRGVWMVTGLVNFYFGYRLLDGTVVESAPLEMQVVE